MDEESEMDFDVRAWAKDMRGAIVEAIRESKQDAWDEGEKAGHWNATERMGGPMNNPYRKE